MVIALVAASLPEIVRTMVEADFFEGWVSVVSHLGGRGRWIPGLKSWTSDWTVLKELVVGMPWTITLYQISAFLRPVAAGMVALMASSMAEWWDLRTERVGVLSLVISLMLWFVVNSILAIRDLLIAELMTLPMVRLLVSSGSAVPFLSMTMVRSHFVKTEGVACLLGGVVVEGAAGALAAFWAYVRVGSGAIGLDGGVFVVVAAGYGLCCCCSWAVRVVIRSLRS